MTIRYGFRCECGHTVEQHTENCLHCACDRISGLRRTLIQRPEDGSGVIEVVKAGSDEEREE